MNWGTAPGYVARCGFFSLLAWVALGTTAARAAAEEPLPLERAVHLEPGATCLETARLLDHVETWLGGAAIDGALSVQVEGSPSSPRVVSFKLLLRDAALTERRFDPGPARCEDLHAAVGLAIALAFKAAALEGTAPADPGVPRTIPAPPEPAWSAGAGAIGGALVLPGATFGGSLWLQHAFGRGWGLRFGVLGLLAPPRELDSAGRGFDAWLASGRLDVCFTLAAIGSTRLAALSGITIGAIGTRGRGLTAPSSDLTPHFALAFGLSLAFEVTRHWSLALAPTLVAPLTRKRFDIRNTANETVARDTLPAAGAFLSLGIARRF